MRWAFCDEQCWRLKLKRALVLSGGGSKGAYSVGAVKALLESGRQYDVVAGVSVGALIGAYVAQQIPTRQWENFQILEGVWTKDVASDRSIYKPWAPWILTYVWSLWKTGIYNMKPLRNILKGNVESEKLRETGVEFEVGVVSLQTGKYHSINITSEPANNELAVDWIWASCVFPVLFPPVKIGGEQWVDGGVRDVIPIKDVMKYNPTHIDVVITSPRDGYVPLKKSDYRTTLDVGIRSAELLSDEVYSSDLSMATENPNVSVEIFDPDHLVNKDSFKFDPKEIKKLIELGYNETKAKLSSK